MAEGVPDQDGGDAIHRRVLDSGIRRIRAAWLRCMAGECEGHQESSGEEERRSGKPMVAEVAYLRVIEEVVPADAGDPCLADLLARTGRIRATSRRLHSADAEGTDRDEPSVNDGTERPQRSNGNEHHPVDCGRRAGRRASGRVQRARLQSQQGDHRQKSGRHVAPGTAGDIEAATGGLGACAKADGRLRSGSAGSDAGAAGGGGRTGTATARYKTRQAEARAEKEGLEERTELRSGRGTEAGSGRGPDAY